MSYTPGTDLGRLREMLGDTNPDDELFEDEYLNDLISRFGVGNNATVAALKQLLNDTDMLIKKFRKFGPIRMQDIPQLRRSVLETIEYLERSGDLGQVAETWEPEPDQSGVGVATDEAGWHKISSIDDVLQAKRLL